jgi:hypothetical protein
MTKRLKFIPTGRFKGKKITFAPTDLAVSFADIADDFMYQIFDLRPSDYAISDESIILDFVPIDELDTSNLWQRIEEIYGIDSSDVKSERLVEIFAAIDSRRKMQ